MFFTQKQYDRIQTEIRELLNTGVADPEKSLKLKAIFDKYRKEAQDGISKGLEDGKDDERD